MQLALQPSPPPTAIDRHNGNFFLALLFWAFTYALFTYRANLRYGDAYELISAVRLVPTMLGAGLYWLVLSKLIDGTRNRPGKPLTVVATILPASIVILLVRVLLDQLGADNPNGFAGDLRFVMVWGGYFGLWVSASFVLRTMPGAAQSPAPASARVVQPQEEWKAAATQARAAGSVPVSAFDRLVQEIAAMPEADRKALIEEFTIPLTYETADELEAQPQRGPVSGSIG